MSKKLIWDLPTRIFHWLLAILIGAAWLCLSITVLEHLRRGEGADSASDNINIGVS